MIALMVGCAVAAVIVMTAIQIDAPRSHVRALKVDGLIRDESNDVSPFAFVGRAISRVPLVGRHVQTAERQRTVGLAAMVAVPVALLSVRMAFVVAVVLVCRPLFTRRSEAKRRSRAATKELPFIAEMLVLAINSGLNITMALQHVIKYSTGPVSQELRHALSDMTQGRRLADALEAAGQRLNEDVRILTIALVSSERYGAPLTTSLERLAFETRRAQERQAEEAGQKLAVHMLAPIAVTTMPAFVALTMPPLIAGSIGTLALHF